MAQTIAVVRNALNSTLSSTTDFTRAAFGAPSAALFFQCNANATANPAQNATMSIGFWDTTNARCIGIFAGDAGDAPRNSKSSDSRSVLVQPRTLTLTNTHRFDASAITDGVRLTMSENNASTLQRLATAFLLKGISAKAGTISANATQNGTSVSGSLGFNPQLIIFTSIAYTVANTVDQLHAQFTVGVADINGTHRASGWGATDSTLAAAAETIVAYYSETRCGGIINVGSTVLTAGFEVTDWGADTFTITTRDGSASGGNMLFYIALGGADLSYDIISFDTPTAAAPQTQVITTDVTPAGGFLVLTANTATGVQQGAAANSFMVGIADGAGQFTHNFSSEDGAAITHNTSVAKAAQMIDLDGSSAGVRTEVMDATGSFNATDITLNWSATNTTIRKGWGIVFGGISAAPAYMAMMHRR